MGAFVSSFVSSGPPLYGVPISQVSETWGPRERQGKAWLFIGGRGHENHGGHYALFLDLGGNSIYGDAEGDEMLPERFSGILVHLGLVETDEGTRMRVAVPLIHYFNNEDGFFDASWCDKILTLSPGFENHKKAATPRAWARDIETLAMECFEDMARRTAGDDTTDAHFESIANHELEKAGWDYRVDFLTPKELWGRRWDEQLNSHTFAAHVADKMNLAWPGTTPIVPTYSYWLLDSMLAAPGSKSLTAAESSARPHTPFATSHRATTPVPIATI